MRKRPPPVTTVARVWRLGDLDSVELWRWRVGLPSAVDTHKKRYKGISLTKQRPPLQDPPRPLGIGLRQGPRGVVFLMSEVPL